MSLFAAATRAGAGLWEAIRPPAPRNLAETGLPGLFVQELLAKQLFRRGQQSLRELSVLSCLPLGVLSEVLEGLRALRVVELVGRGELDTDAVYTLTDQGRSRAEAYLARCQYVGPAPVSLEAYLAQISRQTIRGLRVTRADVEAAFAHVRLAPELVDRLGPAMNSHRAMFVYGPAGSGKTFIAEQLVRLLRGGILVPHAVLVDTDVIQVYDNLIHLPWQGQEGSAGSGLLLERRNEDLRWQVCQRPVVVTGGELTLSMLDLQYDEVAGFYQAPPQMKANNGLYIIDDLGRQLVSPRDLLNRWIVPMDRQVDFLALRNGKKFTVPFDVKVVFSSNLAPHELADDAFIRRLGYKILVGPVSEVHYRGLVEDACARLGVGFDEAGFAHLLNNRHRAGNIPLLACYPRDLLNLILDVSAYRGCPPLLVPDLIDWAWTSYFARA